MEIYLPFEVIAIAIIKLFVLMAVGYFLYFKRVMNDVFLDKLSLLLVNVLFPCLIFHRIVSSFRFDLFAGWWMLPVCGAALSLVGVFIGFIVNRTILRFPFEKEFMCSTGFQNCGYLPMVLLEFAFSGYVRDRLVIYVFLFIVGFNLLVWGLLPMFLSGNLNTGFRVKHLFTPPVVATGLSLLWVWISGAREINPLIMDPLSEIGRSSFPFAMICLGGYLRRYGVGVTGDKIPLAVGVFLKIVVLPALVLVLLYVFPFNSDLMFFLFLQSVMPTATSLVVIGSYAGGNNAFFSLMIFYTHLAAMFIIPVWFEIYFRVMGAR